MYTAITENLINDYDTHLCAEERSIGTRKKYCRDITAFMHFLKDDCLSKNAVIAYRDNLIAANYAPVTINSMIAALNGFFDFIGRGDCRLKFLKVQRKLFREKSRDLSKSEYDRLIKTAYKLGRERTALLMETICACGIRVSEVKYITVSALEANRADISLKGKIRTILIPQKLCRKLLKYARKQKVTAGEIFLTRSGKGMSRGQIWAEMKLICKAAKVEATKVFPHNLRHLFASVFYKSCKDIVKLADILGHSSVDTTRIYLITTGNEHQRQLEKLSLVI